MVGYKQRMVLVALLALCAVAGCSKSTPLPDARLLAKVNGTPISQRDLDLAEDASGHDSTGRKKSLDDLITEELFYQQGIKLGLDKDPGYRKQLDKVEQAAHGTAKKDAEFAAYKASQLRPEMARRVFNTQIAARVDIRMPEVKEYFEKNKDRITSELHLGLMRFAARDQAVAALKKLRGGASFEAVALAAAREQEQEKGAGNQTGEKNPKGSKADWDLGFVPWQEVPIDFVEAIYRLKPGEVSDVLGSPRAGFQIVKLLERRGSHGKADFDGMKGLVMNRLRDLKILQVYDQYVADLKKNARIETF
jgi:peptidyl-prolyl cis-trans isomerase C